MTLSPEIQDWVLEIVERRLRQAGIGTRVINGGNVAGPSPNATADHNHTAAAYDGGPLSGAMVDSFLEFEGGSAPATPSTGRGRLYVDSDRPIFMDDTGTTFDLTQSDQFAQIVNVAKAGADFTSIQDAIDSIIDADATKRYLVLVHPGLYAEQVTMSSWIAVRGIDRISVQIEYGSTGGAVIMDDNTEISNLTIENSSTEGHWGIVATSKTGVHIRNVSLLAPFGSSKRGAGIKITGSSWTTVFIEDVVINTFTQTNQGIYIQGDNDLMDVNLKSVFVDALEATTGGAILIDQAEDTHLRDVYSRVASAAYGLRVTGDSIVDITSCYFEAGTQSIEINDSTVYMAGTPITNSDVASGGVLVGHGRGVTVQRTTNQSIAHATDVAVQFGSVVTEQVSRYGDWWDVGLTTRVIVPYHGWFVITCNVTFSADELTGNRYLALRVNGSGGYFIAAASVPALASGITNMNISMGAYLNRGDYVEALVQQTNTDTSSMNLAAARMTVLHYF
jgi:hypothetical protein